MNHPSRSDVEEAIKYWKDMTTETPVNPIKGLHYVNILLTLATQYLAEQEKCPVHKDTRCYCDPRPNFFKKGE